MFKKIKKADEAGSWLGRYTVIFSIVCLLVYLLQIYYGKSFVYSEESLSGDGLVQHFNSLAYYGSWLRSILNNIFLEHSFSIPEYDLSIGLGGDIVTTLNYYVLGDPLNLLSVLVPTSLTEYLYHALVIIRLYLAGITFYLYCRYHSYEDDRILPGTIIYVFSFYSIAISVLHPSFLNPLIYFPLILMGADKIMKERKPLLFILSCALSAASNFYFFYMITILMVIYCVIRYVQYHLREIRLLLLLQEVGRFAWYYIIAAMIAAPVFLPNVAAVLGSNRVGGRSSVPVIYELIYYIKLPIAFWNASADYYSCLGYGSIAALALVLLFFKTKWKEKIGFKIAFLVGTIFLMFPFFGHMLNGFGYVTNRWVWGYCFLVSLIVVEMFPDITNLSEAGKWVAAGATVLFAVPTFYFRAGGSKEKLLFAVGLLLIFTVILSMIILVCRHCKYRAITYFLIMIAGIFLNAFGFNTPFSGDYLRNHGNFASAWQDIKSGPFSVLEGMEDNSRFDKVRIDTSNLYFTGVRANSAMLQDVNSVSFYYSVINESTNTFLHDLWVPSPCENRYVDLDSRTMLSAILGVKYNIVRAGEMAYLPNGYDHLIQEKNGYALFETDVTLPMAFMYDSVMNGNKFDALLPTQKEQVMLQAAVVSEDALKESDINLPRVVPENLDIENTISIYEIESSEGVKVNGNRIEVEEMGGTLTLKTDSAECVERCFSFANLYYEGNKNSFLTITDGVKSKSFEVKSSQDNAYADIHNFLCNLGYSERHSESFTISFSEPGIYTYDSIEIINQPLEKMEGWIRARKKTPVDYYFGEDHISLYVNPDKEKLLYVSIPYSDGWKAYVDGKKSKILKTNNFGLGILVEQGEHTIELSYHTPYMRVGAGLMVLGIIFCLVVSWKHSRSNPEI